ncbi:guanylate kinase [candidate division KSB1 bacterium]|nr:guanylate kinase [candidate division KSB1 bacterium]
MNEESSRYRGLLVLISAPSGGGKTTIIRRLLKDKSLPLAYSVSMTTRPMRKGERDGVDYFFVDEKEFRRRIRRGLVIEYEKVHGHLYGTPREPVERALAEGKILLFDIDVNGALDVQREYPHQSLLLFLVPPDLDVLRQRLEQRATESPEVMKRRLQRVELEMAKAQKFDCQIINDHLDRTLDELRDTVVKHWSGRKTQPFQTPDRRSDSGQTTV